MWKNIRGRCSVTCFCCHTFRPFKQNNCTLCSCKWQEDVLCEHRIRSDFYFKGSVRSIFFHKCNVCDSAINSEFSKSDHFTFTGVSQNTYLPTVCQLHADSLLGSYMAQYLVLFFFQKIKSHIQSLKLSQNTILYNLNLCHRHDICLVLH